MTTFFGPDFFTANRDRLRTQLGNDTPVVITGNGFIQKRSDESFKFTQDSNFWYLTGLENADLTLVMGRKDTYLIVPSLSFEREAFDGTIDATALAARSGLTRIVTSKDGWALLKQELAGAKTVATLAAMPSYIKRHGLYTLPFRRRLIEKLKRLNPQITIQDVRLELAQLRCVKQPEELAAIQKAIDITMTTLGEITAPDKLASIQHEYELEAALSYGFRMRGASGHAFAPVVGAGEHSTTLHYLDNDGPVAKQDLIVLDIGAEFEHYASDVARTVSLQPITGRAAEVFHAVAAAQDYAISLIKPGVQPIDYEKTMETFMGDCLRKLGVIKSDRREDIRRYFPHATSHFIGLDTHDVGDYRQPFQANMVISCEPGIYLPKEKIGVRIEDDLLITDSGCKVLSAACPRELSPVQ
jgi:Xaa-Pro aminopeptidase